VISVAEPDRSRVPQVRKLFRPLSVSLKMSLFKNSSFSFEMPFQRKSIRGRSVLLGFDSTLKPVTRDILECMYVRF
jgi:hypothetical protein